MARLFSPEILFEGIEAIEKFADRPNWSLKDAINQALELGRFIPVPGVPLGVKSVELLRNIIQKPSTEKSIALVSLGAYMESYKEFIKKDNSLFSSIENNPVSKSFKQEIQGWDEFELESEYDWKAAGCFHETKLAKEFGKVLSARLQDAGIAKKEADIWTKRVAGNTHRYLYKAWDTSPEAVKKQTTSLFDKWQQEEVRYQDIENYLRKQIANKLDDKVFDEEFTFKDIYVPLKANTVYENREVDYYYGSFDLKDWAIRLLDSSPLDSSQSDRVMFVQGGPGRGKSLFCRMFANWVRTHRYPLWIPVLIRLRDIQILHPKFEHTLRDAVPAKFSSDNTWLECHNIKYLFLLDGFDELLLEGRTSGGLKDFLTQVAKFQQDSHEKKMGHRVLITGRPLALQGIELQMPYNMERVSIAVMDDSLQQQWLEKWEKHVGAEAANAFNEFLQDSSCPKRVKELAREPLLLYLLAAMHRDRQLQRSDFEGASGTEAKIRIYQKSLEWVLTKQRQASQLRELTGHDEKDLRRILAEVGLCVVQSGGEIASVKAIESRLNQGENAQIFSEEARKLDNLRNALTVFYLQKGRSESSEDSAESDSSQGSVEFVHKSFGEFLCAECIAKGLEAWTASEQPPWPIYDLLGYGALTPEIVEYLMGLLTASKKFDPVQLFQRLSDFYYRWAQGEFIDTEEPEILPLRKMRQLQAQGIKQGQRRVDVYAGLNVMIIWSELHSYAQKKDDLKSSIAFYPCGKPNSQAKLEDKGLLLRIIGYSHCIGASGFRDTVGLFLRDAFLSGADLRGADLNRANLNLADLSRASLGDANISGVDLRGADLRGADLRGADLSRADLRGASISGADLSRADLRGADLSNSILKDVRWSSYTKWENVRGLETARNIPEALKQQLGL